MQGQKQIQILTKSVYKYMNSWPTVHTVASFIIATPY